MLLQRANSFPLKHQVRELLSCFKPCPWMIITVSEVTLVYLAFFLYLYYFYFFDHRFYFVLCQRKMLGQRSIIEDQSSESAASKKFGELTIWSCWTNCVLCYPASCSCTVWLIKSIHLISNEIWSSYLPYIRGCQIHRYSESFETQCTRYKGSPRHNVRGEPQPSSFKFIGLRALTA